ncbi:MAG TPA: flagellar hook-associated protein FlgK [Longimicrobiales bacterium]
MIGSVLSIAAGAMTAHQKAAQVTSHNVANAATEGYSRQRAILTPAPALQTPYGALGTGVLVTDIGRIQDAFADLTFWRNVGQASDSRARHDVLERVEQLYGEPSDTGLSSALDAFWSAWGDLASQPGGAAQRSAVRYRGEAVALHLNRLAEDLMQLRLDTERRLSDAVARLNELAQQVAALNRDILAAEAGGVTAADLRDARGRLLDAMAELATIRIVEQPQGAVAVIVDNVVVVDGATTRALEVRAAGTGVALGVAGDTAVVPRPGGQIGALAGVVNVDIPEQIAELDALAAALVQEVNALHRAGTNPAGATGVDFFDPAGLTAASIRLSAAVDADPDQIAAGSADANGNYQSGANDIALRIAALRDAPAAALGESIGAFYNRLVSDLGARVASAADATAAGDTLVAAAKARREGVRGVSLDEEMVMLMRHQAAYAAAARVVTVADEMIEALLAMG